MKNFIAKTGIFMLCLLMFSCSQEEKQPEMAELQLDFSSLDLSGMDFGFEKDEHLEVPENMDEKIFVSEKMLEFFDELQTFESDPYVKQLNVKISIGNGKLSLTEKDIFEASEEITTHFDDKNLLASCQTEECIKKTINSIMENHEEAEITTFQLVRKRNEPLKIYK